ncbi:MAG: hypothetical protein LIO86_00375 [Lachnospiraceae bacterium]|nr:hypothetical protein [Lachnospiraceae bacterium]
MSNPAVVTLQNRHIENHAVWLDDNFGESIHIHIDDFRADLTNAELRQMCSDLCEAINALVDIPGFDCHRIDPVFLEMQLGGRLRHLTKVGLDEVAPKDMQVLWNGVEPLGQSMCVRALKGDTEEIDRTRDIYHEGQKDRERLDALLESVRENGYPYQGEYMILYGDDNIIMDGQHRAACLWELDPEKAVPVLRFYFDNYVTPAAIPKWKRNAAYQSVRKCGRALRSGIGLLTHPRKLYRQLKENKKKRAQRRADQREAAYLREHRAEHDEITQLFLQK